VAREALAVLLRHHDALRLRCAEEDGVWRQQCLANEESLAAPWSRLDLTALDPARGRAALEQAAGAAQASLDLESGTIVRGLWLDLPDGGARLLLVVHHWAVDFVSWQVLLEDLEHACRRLAQGEAVELSACHRREAISGVFDIGQGHVEAIILEIAFFLGDEPGAVTDPDRIAQIQLDRFARLRGGAGCTDQRD
jgi:hypothetical protein